MNFLLIFSIFLIAQVLANEPYDCNGINEISAPANLNSIINYPSFWNVNQTAPIYQLNQNCRWNIEIPRGFFVFLSLSADTPSPSNLQLTYSNGKIDKVSGYVENAPYFFVAPKFSIVLQAASLVVGKLGFEVKYVKMPEFNPVNYSLSTSDPEVITNPTSSRITAPSQVSLIASRTASYDFYYFTRCFVVFDGPTANSTFLANLFQVLDSGKQLVSSGKTLIVVNLMPEVVVGNSILVQEYSNVKQFANYRLEICTPTSTSSSCYLNLDASYNTSAISLISNSTSFLKAVHIAPTSSLDVYYGAIKTSNLVESYQFRTSGFPQKLNNYITTFVLDSNTGLLEVSYENLTTSWQTSAKNRVGFVTSPNFGTVSYDQDVTEFFAGNGNGIFNYTTRIIDSGLIGKATLQFITYDNSDNVVENRVYSEKNVPAKIGQVSQGKSLRILYRTNGENTTGILMDFSIL